MGLCFRSQRVRGDSPRHEEELSVDTRCDMRSIGEGRMGALSPRSLALHRRSHKETTLPRRGSAEPFSEQQHSNREPLYAY